MTQGRAKRSEILEEYRKWSAASFRVMGEMLDPAEIDGVLGVNSTHSHRSGERSRSNVVYRESLWSLESPLNKAEGLDKHLEWLIDKLEPRVEEVRSLSRKYRVDFFCGFGSVNGQGGFTLAGRTLVRIARFEVPLGLDLYPPLPTDEEREVVPPKVN